MSLAILFFTPSPYSSISFSSFASSLGASSLGASCISSLVSVSCLGTSSFTSTSPSGLTSGTATSCAPSLTGSSGNVTEQTTHPTQPVASATRNVKRGTGRKTVKLTSSQVAIAKKLNVPLEEYAKQLNVLEE